jgi:hypothetical protein
VRLIKLLLNLHNHLANKIKTQEYDTKSHPCPSIEKRTLTNPLLPKIKKENIGQPLPTFKRK